MKNFICYIAEMKYQEKDSTNTLFDLTKILEKDEEKIFVKEQILEKLDWNFNQKCLETFKTYNIEQPVPSNKVFKGSHSLQNKSYMKDEKELTIIEEVDSSKKIKLKVCQKIKILQEKKQFIFKNPFQVFSDPEIAKKFEKESEEN